MRRQDGAVGGSRVEIKRGMREMATRRRRRGKPASSKTADKDKGPPENRRPTD
jgi:hypothetical protein